MSSAFKSNTLGLRSLWILIASHGLRLNGRQGTGEDGAASVARAFPTPTSVSGGRLFQEDPLPGSCTLSAGPVLFGVPGTGGPPGPRERG